MSISDFRRSIITNQKLDTLFRNQNQCIFSITHEGIVEVWQGIINNKAEIEAEYAEIKKEFEVFIKENELTLSIRCKQLSRKDFAIDMVGRFGIVSF